MKMSDKSDANVTCGQNQANYDRKKRYLEV